ncbi:hypothetical protein GCM10012285_66030 [Streptomyces kronopolitis]|uniref:Uncharacterized protein n=1 Tax=Streptomyces kronopolitis TaxID=1612435 RepID=A0ABQ2K4H1_9ACTN|nr:hypothetical protein [Streptomyces kronopolitis]GGN64195.1 hypothetical protein GCM10012285_66030 [Streptomyces kronopolitis]
MEPQIWRSISVRWRRPHASDFIVAGALYYLLYLQPEVHKLVAAAVWIAALRCIRIERTV